MTAEIAVLNKLAVTLAADSAVTVNSRDATKVYNSADKIFEATVHDPIGLMVYNRPELCGVPVETIVKMYRDKHCPGHFSTVFDFADAFLKHIQEYETPNTTAKANINTLISSKAFGLRDMLRDEMGEFIRTAAKEKYPSVDELLEALEDHICETLDAEIAALSALQTPEWANGITESDVLAHHGEWISEFVDWVFEGDELPDQRKKRVESVLALALIKEFERSALTGLVFAGFGRDEIFPSLISFEVYGTIAGRLKHVRQVKFDVDRELVPDAAAFPFAQKEMVDRFMYGLDGEFLELCTTYFSGALNSLKGHLGTLIDDADHPARAALEPAVDEILDEFRSRIIPDHLQGLRNQFSDMIRSMPKEELAALAESLVHITSLKRKFSAGAESVGGPIDVAMITRAEGLVWVKRKHFFDASLNPRYFYRRYGGNPTGQPNADINKAE